MKIRRKFGAIILALIAIFTAAMTCFAVTERTVSPALAVISRNISLIKSGLCGEEITFTAEDFETTLGVDKLDTVVILSLPSPESGTLMLGELEVMENQTISRANLSALRFLPSGDGEVSCNFVFRAGNSEEYDMNCLLYTLSEKNYAPTLAGSDDSDMSMTTYKNIAVYGSMYANDPENDDLIFEVTSYPKKGVLTVTDRCSGDFIYTPSKNYTGNDSFSYTATDKYGNRSGEITVRVNVTRSESGVVYKDLIGQKEQYGAILLTDRGIIEGREENEECYFDPDGEVSRAEYLKMVMQAVGISVYDKGTTVSTAQDIMIPSACRPYASLAREKGLLDENIMNDLSASVSRAEACAVTAKLIGADKASAKESMVLSDASEIPEWAETSVYALLDKGIVSVSDDTFDPNGALTRAEAVSILTSIISYTER